MGWKVCIIQAAEAADGSLVVFGAVARQTPHPTPLTRAKDGNQ